VSTEHSDISVVIPAYNAEAWIVECIRSVAAQSLPPFEIIVADDCSSDATVQKVQELMQMDSRIRLIQLPQKPAPKRRTAAALNAAIAYATGSYIALMDADDVSCPDRFERQMAWLEQHPSYDAVGGWVQVIDKNGKKGKVLRKPAHHLHLQALLPLSSPFYQNTVMLRAPVLKQHPLRYEEELEYAEDYEFFSRLARIVKVGNVQEVLVYYRQHAQQSVRNPLFVSCVQKTSIREFSLSYPNEATKSGYFWQLANHREVEPDGDIDKLLSQIRLFFDQLKQHNPQSDFDIHVLRQELTYKRIISWPHCNPKLLIRLLQHVELSFLMKKKHEVFRFTLKCLLFYDQSG
jgi:glycosyltransferase involved in cell wall biosynthesis